MKRELSTGQVKAIVEQLRRSHLMAAISWGGGVVKLLAGELVVFEARRQKASNHWDCTMVDGGGVTWGNDERKADADARVEAGETAEDGEGGGDPES